MLLMFSMHHLLASQRKDYEEVGIETAEGEGEEEGYGDEF